MTIEELKLHRLSGQYLLSPASYHTVVRGLCGVQAQFLSNAFHALRIRSTDFDAVHPKGLIKSWTLRGTMHLFDEQDLPLMLYSKREHKLRLCDMLGADEYITEERKRDFADLIIASVQKGTFEREALRQICFDNGMTETEEQSVFNSWGGLLRALCEAGKLTHEVSSRKAFVPCPPFEPMEREAAQLKLMYRYLAHYGPATVRDAAFFFKWTQSKVRQLIEQLEPQCLSCSGQSYYYIEDTPVVTDRVPACIFLAGFDPLMMGYDKKDNLFLPEEHVRGIFNLAGIVHPALLVHGRVMGRWKREGNKLTITPFEAIAPEDAGAIRAEAMRLWPHIKRVDGI